MRILPLLFIMVTFAGCAGDAPEPVTDNPLGLPDVEAGPDTGAIQGVVVDTAIVPIVGATITIGALGIELVTDENGGFGISDMEPGIYAVDVSAPLYLPAQQVVEVVAGQASKARILLQADPTPLPYHETLKYNGFVGLWAPGASYVVQLLFQNDTICRCQTMFSPGKDVTEFVFEAIWEPSLSVPTMDQMSWELDSYAHGSLDNQEGEYSTSPIYARLNRTLYSPAADEWLARITPGIGAGIYIQQSYEMFVSTFYHGAAPQGFSIINP